MLLVTLLALYCCAAVMANQRLPRHEIVAKMIERAKQMDSLAADEIKAVLGHELQPPLHGKAFQPLLPSFSYADASLPVCTIDTCGIAY